MKKLFLSIISLILIFSLSSCVFVLPSGDGSGSGSGEGSGSGSGSGDDEGSGGAGDGQGSEQGGSGDSSGDGQGSGDGDPVIKDEVEDWGGASSVARGASITVVKGKPTDITHLVDEAVELDGAAWTTACSEVATVENGIVTGVKYGRTDITVCDEDGDSCIVTVTVEFLLNADNGFSFATTEDTEKHYVTSEYEADRLIEQAILNHKSKISIDFSGIGAGYNAVNDYDVNHELGNYVGISFKYYKSNPNDLTFDLDYHADAASSFTELDPSFDYGTVASGNMIARLAANKNSPYARSDSFDGFAIYENNSGTMAVYNSEELWWALEHNYLPVFPTENSKAELFFERAKMILRDIITDDMTDYEKVLAIFDYLVDNVAYDYSAYSRIDDASYKNVCYYLEGVFERGMAVCDGKSKAFVLLCSIEGIECLRDFGSGAGDGVGHAWNYVKIEDRWYLVDTTAADSTQEKSSGIGSFFGRAIELNTYEKFMVNVNALADKYEYSGIYDISSMPSGDLSMRFIEEDIIGTEYDFYFDNENELCEVLALAVESGMVEEFILVFNYNSATVNIARAINTLLYELGVDGDYSAYTTTVSGNSVCYIAFKIIK